MPRVNSLQEFFKKYGDYRPLLTRANRDYWRELFEWIGVPDEHNFWMWREAIRLMSGDYTPLNHEVDEHAPPEHFAHVSKEKDICIAFTPESDWGLADRQMRTRAGKYFQKWCGVKNKEDVRKLANKFTRWHGEGGLRIATDPEEIQWVYQNGPHSCMANPSCVGNIHPVKVYGYKRPGAKLPDTAVGYVMSKDDRGVAARTVLNMRNKTWIRLYGADDLIRPLLIEAGFKSDGSLQGCRVHCHLVNNGMYVLMPYLDGGCNNFFVNDDVDSPHCEIHHDGQYEASNEYGYYGLESGRNNGQYCNGCDDYVDGEMYSTYGGEEHVCHSCFQDYVTAYIDQWGTTHYCHREDGNLYQYRGSWYTQSGLAFHNLTEINGDIYAEDDTFTCPRCDALSVSEHALEFANIWWDSSDNIEYAEGDTVSLCQDCTPAFLMDDVPEVKTDLGITLYVDPNDTPNFIFYDEADYNGLPTFKEFMQIRQIDILMRKARNHTGRYDSYFKILRGYIAEARMSEGVALSLFNDVKAYWTVNPSHMINIISGVPGFPASVQTRCMVYLRNQVERSTEVREQWLNELTELADVAQALMRSQRLQRIA